MFSFFYKKQAVASFEIDHPKFSITPNSQNIESLLKYIEITHREFIVVGGASIYEAFLPYVDTMYLTEIDDYAIADTYFPSIDLNDWDIETIYNHEGNYKNKDNINYIRNKYVRRRIK